MKTTKMMLTLPRKLMHLHSKISKMREVSSQSLIKSQNLVLRSRNFSIIRVMLKKLFIRLEIQAKISSPKSRLRRKEPTTSITLTLIISSGSILKSKRLELS